MKDTLIHIMVLIIFAALVALVSIFVSEKSDECRRKGGVLVQGVVGFQYKCVGLK